MATSAKARPSLGQLNSTFRISARNFVAHRVNDKLEDFYTVLEKLGEGGYGEVFQCQHKASGAERAVKILEKSKYDEQANAAVRKEFQIVKHLDHPNIMKEYELFEDDKKFYIVTDIYKGGELFDSLEEMGTFPEKEAALLMLNILGGVNYIHSQGLIHRDLKTENVLLEATKRSEDIKIIDFGLAAYYTGLPLTEMIGSPTYLSPQVIQELPYGPKADVWSCGVIAFILLAGYTPFDGPTFEIIQNEIIMGKVSFDEPEWTHISFAAKDFVHKLLAYEEADRPTAQEALEHPWLKMTRKASRRNLFSSDQSSKKASSALSNMKDFGTRDSTALKQATYALISSQLLAKEDKEGIDEIFRAMDSHSKGRLTKGDVQEGYKMIFGQQLSRDEVDSLFATVNFSGSGYIEYSEFVAACLIENNFMDDDKLKAAFRSFDTDNNGLICLSDLKQVLSVEQGMFDDEALENIMKQVTKKSKNAIDFDDFKCMMLLTAAQPSKEAAVMWEARKTADLEINCATTVSTSSDSDEDSSSSSLDSSCDGQEKPNEEPTNKHAANDSVGRPGQGLKKSSESISLTLIDSDDGIGVRSAEIPVVANEPAQDKQVAKKNSSSPLSIVPTGLAQSETTKSGVTPPTVKQKTAGGEPSHGGSGTKTSTKPKNPIFAAKTLSTGPVASSGAAQDSTHEPDKSFAPSAKTARALFEALVRKNKGSWNASNPFQILSKKLSKASRTDEVAGLSQPRPIMPGRSSPSLANIIHNEDTLLSTSGKTHKTASRGNTGADVFEAQKNILRSRRSLLDQPPERPHSARSLKDIDRSLDVGRRPSLNRRDLLTSSQSCRFSFESIAEGEDPNTLASNEEMDSSFCDGAFCKPRLQRRADVTDRVSKTDAIARKEELKALSGLLQGQSGSRRNIFEQNTDMNDSYSNCNPTRSHALSRGGAAQPPISKSQSLRNLSDMSRDNRPLSLSTSSHRPSDGATMMYFGLREDEDEDDEEEEDDRSNHCPKAFMQAYSGVNAALKHEGARSPVPPTLSSACNRKGGHETKEEPINMESKNGASSRGEALEKRQWTSPSLRYIATTQVPSLSSLIDCPEKKDGHDSKEEETHTPSQNNIVTSKNQSWISHLCHDMTRKDACESKEQLIQARKQNGALSRGGALEKPQWKSQSLRQVVQTNEPRSPGLKGKDSCETTDATDSKEEMQRTPNKNSVLSPFGAAKKPEWTHHSLHNIPATHLHTRSCSGQQDVHFTAVSSSRTDCFQGSIRTSNLGSNQTIAAERATASESPPPSQVAGSSESRRKDDLKALSGTLKGQSMSRRNIFEHQLETQQKTHNMCASPSRTPAKNLRVVTATSGEGRSRPGLSRSASPSVRAQSCRFMYNPKKGTDKTTDKLISVDTVAGQCSEDTETLVQSTMESKYNSKTQPPENLSEISTSGKNLPQRSKSFEDSASRFSRDFRAGAKKKNSWTRSTADSSSGDVSRPNTTEEQISHQSRSSFHVVGGCKRTKSPAVRICTQSNQLEAGKSQSLHEASRGVSTKSILENKRYLFSRFKKPSQSEKNSAAEDAFVTDKPLVGLEVENDADKELRHAASKPLSQCIVSPEMTKSQSCRRFFEDKIAISKQSRENAALSQLGSEHPRPVGRNNSGSLRRSFEYAESEHLSHLDVTLNGGLLH